MDPAAVKLTELLKLIKACTGDTEVREPENHDNVLQLAYDNVPGDVREYSDGDGAETVSADGPVFSDEEYDSDQEPGNELAAKDAKIDTLMKELAASKTAHAEELAAKDVKIDTLMTELAAKDALVMAHRETLAAEWRANQAKDEVIASLQEQVAAKDAELAAKDAELAAKDAELANAETNVPGEDVAATMKEELTVELRAELRASMTLMIKQMAREHNEEISDIYEKIARINDNGEYFNRELGTLQTRVFSPSVVQAVAAGEPSYQVEYNSRGSARQTQRSDNPHYVRNSFSSCPPPPRQ